MPTLESPMAFSEAVAEGARYFLSASALDLGSKGASCYLFTCNSPKWRLTSSLGQLAGIVSEQSSVSKNAPTHQNSYDHFEETAFVARLQTNSSTLWWQVLLVPACAWFMLLEVVCELIAWLRVSSMKWCVMNLLFNVVVSKTEKRKVCAQTEVLTLYICSEYSRCIVSLHIA